MSFFVRQLPRHLTMWILGKSIGAAMDTAPLIRTGLLGLSAVMIGALLAIIALMGLLGALYMCLTANMLLSPALSLLIVSALCASIAFGAFYYMKVVVLDMPRTSLKRIRTILSNSLEGEHGDLFHSSRDIIKNFADGFMRKD